jgi:ribosomal protein S27E
MVGIIVELPRCPDCGSEWIAHPNGSTNATCETCGQKLKKSEGFGYEVD